MQRKYSRQREAIKEFLAGRTDHPTADTVYTCLREQYPNISLGTVYRNLTLLTEMGEIMKITTGEGADRFDANVQRHHQHQLSERLRSSRHGKYRFRDGYRSCQLQRNDRHIPDQFLRNLRTLSENKKSLLKI